MQSTMKVTYGGEKKKVTKSQVKICFTIYNMHHIYVSRGLGRKTDAERSRKVKFIETEFQAVAEA